jgi:hypothetical protein
MGRRWEGEGKDRSFSPYLSFQVSHLVVSEEEASKPNPKLKDANKLGIEVIGEKDLLDVVERYEEENGGREVAQEPSYYGNGNYSGIPFPFLVSIPPHSLSPSFSRHSAPFLPAPFAKC